MSDNGRPIGKSIGEKALDAERLNGATFEDYIDAVNVASYFSKTAPRGNWTAADERERRHMSGEVACRVVADIAMGNLGAALADARGRADMTQEDAAKYSGISLRTIQRIETGKRDDKITFKDVVTLCVLYDVRLERILGMMSFEEEALLKVYAVASESVRPVIIDTVTGLAFGKHSRAKDLIAQDVANERKNFETWCAENGIDPENPLGGTASAELAGRGDSPSVEVTFDGTGRAGWAGEGDSPSVEVTFD